MKLDYYSLINLLHNELIIANQNRPYSKDLIRSCNLWFNSHMMPNMVNMDLSSSMVN